MGIKVKYVLLLLYVKIDSVPTYGHKSKKVEPLLYATRDSVPTYGHTSKICFIIAICYNRHCAHL